MTSPKRPVNPNSDGPRQEFDPNDLAWIGVDGEGDFDRLLAERGYEPEPPLQLIVRAIIAGNGPAEVWPRRREEKALAALTGSSRPGRRAADDYDLLLEIARHWRLEFWRSHGRQHSPGETSWEPPLDPIIRAVIPKGYDKSRNVEAANIRKVLARKFRNDRDLLLARVSSDDNYDRLNMLQRIQDLIRELGRLGISASDKVLPVRLEGRDKTPPI